MESQYRPQRTRNIFSVSGVKPYKLSRSRIEVYMRCKRCFYLDRKCGTEQPPMFPYTLNNAVDTLLKKEFDALRLVGEKHKLLIENGIDAIPYAHADLENWRMNQRGIQYHHESTNFLVTGAIDDVWINPQGDLIIVDYKATSTKKEVTLADRDSYKRQMEIYQWLFRRNGFRVSNTGYFFYCNGQTEQASFDGNLSFKITILPYVGDDSWVEKTLCDIKEILMKDELPEPTKDCDYCGYIAAVTQHIKKHERV